MAFALYPLGDWGSTAYTTLSAYDIVTQAQDNERFKDLIGTLGISPGLG